MFNLIESVEGMFAAWAFAELADIDNDGGPFGPAETEREPQQQEEVDHDPCGLRGSERTWDRRLQSYYDGRDRVGSFRARQHHTPQGDTRKRKLRTEDTL